MKLLTAGGLLYSTVLSANADGTNGSYEKFDWVAMMPETQNVGYATTTMNTGWDPMVTSVLTTYDGGKAIAGFGKVTGTLYKPWVFKMWGNIETKKCGTTKFITGYVQMLPTVNTGLTVANCVATASAQMSWAWTDLASAGVNATLNSSTIIFSMTEDWNQGTTSGTAGVGADPMIILVGAGTWGNTKSWGMLAW